MTETTFFITFFIRAILHLNSFSSPLTRTKMDISIVKKGHFNLYKGKQWSQWVTDLAQIIPNRLHFSGLNHHQRRRNDTSL